MSRTLFGGSTVMVGISVGSVLLGGVVGCRFDPVASVGGRPDGAVQDAMGTDVRLGHDVGPGLDAHFDGPSIEDAAGDALADGSSPDALADGATTDAGCVEGTTRCNGDNLEICDANGNWADGGVCPVGCDANRGTCRRVVASNGIDGLVWSGNEGDLVITGPVTINSDNGTIVSGAVNMTGTYGWGQVSQAQACGGSNGVSMGIGVMLVRSLTIRANGVLRFVGANAVGILSRRQVDVSGVIDVSGGQRACPGGAASGATPNICAGPGGFAGGIGAGGPQAGLGPGAGGAGENGGQFGDEAGGGGAGHGAAGGKGGNATGGMSAEGGAGGPVYGDGSAEPLCGGSGGGGGGPGSGSVVTDDSGHGGGGGGAIQIVSQVRISISCSGIAPCGIRATGAGGRGDHLSTYDDGGGGGGSGGTVLLEAPAIEVVDRGVLSVAGGGGGAGDGSSDSPEGDGAEGPFGAGRAAGGSGSGGGGRGGGDHVLAGEAGTNVDDGGGGGGGAVGRIRIGCYQAPGCFTVTGTINPHVNTSAVVVGEVAVQ